MKDTSFLSNISNCAVVALKCNHARSRQPAGRRQGETFLSDCMTNMFAALVCADKVLLS